MRDARGRSPDPKPINQLLDEFRNEEAPESLIASVQMVWVEVVGEKIAGVTEVIQERDGQVIVECCSSVWAQELEMMGPRISDRLIERLGNSGPINLRFITAG